MATSSIGQRKWTLACGTMVLAFILAWTNSLSAEFVQLAMTVIVVFGGANAAEHFFKNRGP